MCCSEDIRGALSLNYNLSFRKQPKHFPQILCYKMLFTQLMNTCLHASLPGDMLYSDGIVRVISA